jgi:hypothetical protein
MSGYGVELLYHSIDDKIAPANKITISKTFNNLCFILKVNNKIKLNSLLFRVNKIRFAAFSGFRRIQFVGLILK